MLPEFLKNGKAKALTDKLYSQSSCFPFFNPDERIVLCHPSHTPGMSYDYQDFYVTVCGLYALYHDYGARFLTFFLDQSGSNKTKYSLHVRSIMFLRAMISHGHFDISVIDHTINTNFRNYFLKSNTPPTETWPLFFDKLDTKDWKHICMTLKRDADNLYNYLDNWGTSFSADELEQKKQDFRRDRYFADSFDYRLVSDCVRQVKQENSLSVDIGHTTTLYLNLNGNSSTNWIDSLKTSDLSSTAELYRLMKKQCKDYFCPKTANSTNRIINQYFNSAT